MKAKIILPLIILLFILSCVEKPKKLVEPQSTEKSSYFDYSNSDDQVTGGINMIPIETEKGTFNVYTKRMGNNPKMRVLLLHGGPGGTHEAFENFDGYLPNEEIEYIYYDQLDSYYSDKPWL
jgi:proline iminopeptidase